MLVTIVLARKAIQMTELATTTAKNLVNPDVKRAFQVVSSGLRHPLVYYWVGLIAH